MSIAIERKQTAFRLSADLIQRLKIEAKKENRSLNNYVENILMEVVYYEPNETTLAALKEAESGEYAGTIDTLSAESASELTGADS